MISEYINNLLAPRLSALGASGAQITSATADIRIRLTSLVRHWSDRDFTKTLLELGMEEAAGYTPDAADITIRALVVVAVRNSLLEDMGSTQPYYNEFKSPHPPIIDDTDMPAITSEAVEFFDSAYREQGFVCAKPDSQPDIFISLPQIYPATWNALRVASQLDGGTRRIRRIDSPPPDCDLPTRASTRHGSHSITASGIDPRYDDTVTNILTGVRTRSVGLVFFQPSSGLPATQKSYFEFLSSFCARALQSLLSITASSPTRFASAAFY